MKDGILLIDKPSGLSSRAVDNKVAKLVGNKKVGHLGTLDPFATGLLIVGVGKGNKVMSYLPDEEKTYLASLKLGEKTETGDNTAPIIQTKEIPSFDYVKAQEVLDQFLGKQKQIPPMTSAIKINGTALYELAHKGEEIKRQPRDIEVFSVRVVNVTPDSIDFLATVSKGTYMRVLGEDYAEKLGTVGHLTALRRVAIGPIGLEKATPLEEVSESSFVDPRPYFSLPLIEVEDRDVRRIKNGMTIHLFCKDPLVILTYQGDLLAVYEYEDGVYQCRRGLF